MEKLFHHRLDSIHRAWRHGLTLRSVFQALAAGWVLLAVAAMLDLAHPWPDHGRPIVSVTLLVLALVVFIAGLAAVRRHDRAATARRVDEAIGSSRGMVMSAADLAGEPPVGDGIGGMLRERAIASAAEALANVPARGRRPVRDLRRHGARAIGLGLALGILALVFPGPVGTSLRRVIFPQADIPPHSAHVFSPTSDRAGVFYGEDLLLAMEITGPPIDGPVWAQVRDPATGVVSRARCFRGSSGSQFTHRLENVVSPVEVSFALGTARSKWMPVEVLYQPKISAADVEVTPPAYSGLPVERFPVGSKDLRALEGSRVALRVTSNRPLSKGNVAITPINERLADRFGEVVEASAPATREITFVWTLMATANLRVEIFDVRGTPTASPLAISQTALPDNPPSVEMVQPPPVSLATPRGMLPMEVEAEDDFGLARVSYVRSLVGFRDRSESLADGMLSRAFAHRETLDLSRLGAQPGDVLEFFAEAADRNPSLLGISTSDVARVQIISEEEYAAILRARATIDEFSARYQAAMDAMEAARLAVEAMEKAAGSGEIEATARASKEAAAAVARAKEMMDRIARDFPAFEMEKELSEAAAKASQPLEEIQQAIQALGPQPDPAKAAAAARDAMEKLGRAQQPVQQAKQDADLVAKAGKVLELAATLREIHENQRSLAERMTNLAKELSAGVDTNAAQLDGLARLQKDNADRLREVTAELKTRSSALPAELGTFKSDVDAFLEALENAQIDGLMDEAARGAEAGRSHDAAANALMAFQSLDMLFQGSNGMASACRSGQDLRFDLRQNLSQTLRQMMEALGAKPGQGQGNGGGTGMGGMGMGGTGSGYSMPGGSVPAFGPARSSFSMPGGGAGSASGRGGSGRGGAANAPQVIDGAATLESTRRQSTPPPPAERVPEKYRDAVKRYFEGPPAP